MFAVNWSDRLRPTIERCHHSKGGSTLADAQREIREHLEVEISHIEKEIERIEGLTAANI